tara:strand:- start:8277 stop:8393 length:117 start_codon:yes stop_codon:yes gene_type:complete
MNVFYHYQDYENFRILLTKSHAVKVIPKWIKKGDFILK